LIINVALHIHNALPIYVAFKFCDSKSIEPHSAHHTARLTYDALDAAPVSDARLHGGRIYARHAHRHHQLVLICGKGALGFGKKIT
jgi:hypothetical protein